MTPLLLAEEMILQELLNWDHFSTLKYDPPDVREKDSTRIFIFGIIFQH
jgi:hypothetical protein